MIENVKVDKIDGYNVYITVNCSEDQNKFSQEDNVLRVPVRRVMKPPFFDGFDGNNKEPTVYANGMNWPSFAEYVTKNLINGDKKPCNGYKPKWCN